MNTIGLDELLSPLTTQEFFKSYWPGQPLFIPAKANKLSGLFEIPQLQSVEALALNRQLKVRACLPDYDDEYSSIHLDPKDALKAYHNNMTLVFDSMQTQDITISNTLQKIRAELGLVTGGAENDLCKARSIVYATPAGCGTRMHFDANVNFIIQISGSKHWVLAPNTSVENPTERYTTGSFEMSAALEKQCHAPLLDQMPPDTAQEITMTPGSVLFVPRGYWHETTTNEDSLSLNFTFSQPSWADVFNRAIQEHLLQKPEWRALADGLESTDLKRKQTAQSQFQKLLTDLSQQLPKLSGKYLLDESGLG